MSIPASQIVAVNPSVISPGGTALELNGLLLTRSEYMPYGSVLSFSSAEAVSGYFGATSIETAYANIYFGGYQGSTLKPGALLFVNNPSADVVPFLRGGDLASMTLAQLQAIAPGALTISINGTSHVSSSIDLSAATSFSNAAQIIETALASYDAAFTAAIAGTTMTVAAVASGKLAVGQVVSGPGVTAGTVITALGTGTGGTGTYTVSPSQSVSSDSLKSGPTDVLYDSDVGGFVIKGGTPGADASITFASGAIATSLKLTAATGATISQGQAEKAPAVTIANAATLTQNWASFSHTFDLSGAPADMVDLAAWNAAQNSRYEYVQWTTEAAAAQPNDTTSSGYQIQQANYGGVSLNWQPSELYIAPFVMGTIASINFAATNGRITLSGRRLDGLTPGVTDGQTASTLTDNGYNFYGDYKTANDTFNLYNDGSITGEFVWNDSFVNQIQLNNALQLALMVLLTESPSIPYNAMGYGMIEAACQSPINAALNFGSIRAGVTLSPAQAAAVNAAAGLVISTTLQQRGWYLQVLDAAPEVRIARGSPPCSLWYMDGQSVQKITLSSVQVS